MVFKGMKVAALFAVLAVCTSAFQIPPARTSQHHGSTFSLTTSSSPSSQPQTRRNPDTIVMHETKEKSKSKKPFDEGLRTKLVAESIAPWRTLRLFLYGSLGSGAFIGGFITLTGTLAAMSGARADVDLNTEVGMNE